MAGWFVIIIIEDANINSNSAEAVNPEMLQQVLP